MTRTIKFRAFDRESGLMRYQEDPEDKSNVYVSFYPDNSWKMNDGDIDDEMICHSLHAEIMQFTGLKDKNGKDIYEGDVLKVNAKSGIRYMEVVFEEKLCAFNIQGVSHILEFAPVEVVGNIYENPELLQCEESKSNTTYRVI